jgi:hypothetical protein
VAATSNNRWVRSETVDPDRSNFMAGPVRNNCTNRKWRGDGRIAPSVRGPVIGS